MLPELECVDDIQPFHPGRMLNQVDVKGGTGKK
jgi:hypothetical protein